MCFCVYWYDHIVVVILNSCLAKSAWRQLYVVLAEHIGNQSGVLCLYSLYLVHKG